MWGKYVTHDLKGYSSVCVTQNIRELQDMSLRLNVCFLELPQGGTEQYLVLNSMFQNLCRMSCLQVVQSFIKHIGVWAVAKI